MATYQTRHPENFIQDFLSQYQASTHRGFLPEFFPCEALPEAYAEWEELAQQIPSTERDCIRREIEKLPPFPSVEMLDLAQTERAMLVLSVLGQAYLHSGESKVEVLPEQIARPWQDMAFLLGRLPVINHASLVLYNWKLTDPAGGFRIENLNTLLSFTNSLDEKWFFLVTMMVEYSGGVALKHAIGACLAATEGNARLALSHLEKVPAAVRRMQAELEQMYDHCDPDYFYHQIRPWLGGVEGVVYAGTGDQSPRTYAGGSAAQSTLLQVLDASLGIAHQTPYLKAMQAYMPPSHRQLIAAAKPLGQRLASLDLSGGFLGKSREALKSFRQAHLEITAKYVIEPARKAGSSTMGTGGTDALKFLKQIRDESHPE